MASEIAALNCLGSFQRKCIYRRPKPQDTHPCTLADSDAQGRKNADVTAAVLRWCGPKVLQTIIKDKEIKDKDKRKAPPTFLSAVPLFIFLISTYCLVFVSALSLQVVEDDLTHTHALRSDLHILVFLDVLQALLQAHDGLRHDMRLLVGT